MESAYREVEKLLDQIRAVSSSPVIERVSDQIEVLCRAYMEPAPFKDLPESVSSVPMSKSMKSIFALLLARAGHTVSRSAVMDAIYHQSAVEDPDQKIIDVFVCKIRKQLVGTPYEGCIQNVYGLGYRLDLPEEQRKAA